MIVFSGSRGGIAGILGCSGILWSASCAQVSGLDRLSKAQCVDSCDGGQNAPDAAPGTGADDTSSETGAVGGDDGSSGNAADTLDDGDESADALGAVEAGQEASVPDASDAAVDAGGDVAMADAMDSAVVNAGGDAAWDAPSDAARDAPSDAAPEAMACTPITTGLLAHWTMDASSISGTRLADSSGNHNDGTLMGFTSPVTVPGKFGEALSFPPSASPGGYVAMPTTIAMNGAAGGINSISMWFYRSGTMVSDTLINLPNPPNRYDLWLTGATGNLLCINTAHNDCVGVQDNSLAGRWVHVVAMFYNGASVQGRIYIDGQNRNASCLMVNGLGACASSATAAPPVTLGGETSFYFRGLLDEVRIYSRALTATEVNALYYGYACP